MLSNSATVSASGSASNSRQPAVRVLAQVLHQHDALVDLHGFGVPLLAHQQLAADPSTRA
jgi:hypothetical protein